MKVRDHIRRNVITITHDATFREALETMVQQKTNGLIVVDDQNKAIGTIDSFNLIDQMVPDYLSDDPSLAQFATENVFHKAVSEALNRQVHEMMESTGDICVHEDDSMVYAATLASKHDFRYIPVIDDTCDELVGLVSRTDIKRAMAELLGIKDNAAK